MTGIQRAESVPAGSGCLVSYLSLQRLLSQVSPVSPSPDTPASSALGSSLPKAQKYEVVWKIRDLVAVLPETNGCLPSVEFGARSVT